MATLVRWNRQPWTPLRELAAVQGDLSRLVNGFFEGNARAGEWAPALDAWETESEIVYAFDLPGVDEQHISVEVDDGTLTVTAERQRSSEITDGRYHRVERRHGSFSRAVGLPQGVSEEAIKASYVDGVLEIHVPKPAQPKPKRIKIALEGQLPTIDGRGPESEEATAS